MCCLDCHFSAQCHFTVKNHRLLIAGFPCIHIVSDRHNATEQLFCGIGRKHMARFTANSVEIQHLKDTEQELATVASQNDWRVKGFFCNGQKGVWFFLRTKKGRKKGRVGLWCYRGGVKKVWVPAKV